MNFEYQDSSHVKFLGQGKQSLGLCDAEICKNWIGHWLGHAIGRKMGLFNFSFWMRIVGNHYTNFMILINKAFKLWQGMSFEILM